MSHRRSLAAVPVVALFALVSVTSAQAAPPANDNFANAETISGSSLNVLGTTVDATKETGEPLHNATPQGARSVWYSWTAPAAGTVKLDTCGLGTDTILAVYTGTAVNALTDRGSNDDAGNPPCSNNFDDFGSRTRFRAENGATYKIAVDSYDPGSFDLQLDLVTPPANDDFANGQDLTGTPVNATGSTNNASKETGEPQHVTGQRGGASIWFDWVAPSTGSFRIDTCDSSFNTNLAVYTGNSVNALTLVPGGSNPDSCGNRSVVIVNVTAGVAYRIAVDGADVSTFKRGDPQTGDVALSIRVLNPPANDNFANAATLPGFFTQNGTVADATAEPGEPTGGAAGSVWYSWEAPSTGPVSLSSCGSATEVDVYEGNAVGALTATESEASVCDGGQRRTFEVTQGTLYRLRVTKNAGGVSDAFELRMRPASVPPNDLLANATALNGAAPTIVDDNIAATGEADLYGEELPTVWYSWTPPVPGDYRFTACDANFAATPVVHVGDTIATLESIVEEEIPCQDGTGSYSEAFADGTEPLRIAVAGLQEQGEFTLEIDKFNRPVNDDFADATSLIGNSDSVGGSTADASVEENEPNSDGLVSTWHEWTAPSTSEFKVSTCGSQTPTALAIFTGTDVSDLTPIRHPGGGICGQDGDTFGDKAILDAVAGRTYRIQIMSGEGAEGEGTYTLELQRIAPANDAPETTLDPVTVKKTTATATFGATDDGTGVTFECNLDGRGWKDCVSPQKFKRLKPGDHELKVRAIDSEGKLDRSPASDVFKVKRPR